jgi:hypothetical protein
MGIVRLPERDPVRLSTDAREREGRLASNDPPGIGQRLVVVGAPSRDSVAMDGVRHSTADRTRCPRWSDVGGRGQTGLMTYPAVAPRTRRLW